MTRPLANGESDTLAMFADFLVANVTEFFPEATVPPVPRRNP
jgi:hypothetical protein